MGVLRLISSLLDRLFVVAGAFMGSQIPQFMQQYTQRLAGHVEELDTLIIQLRRMANYSNKSLQEYINKFLNNLDPDIALQGEFMQQIVIRWEDLSQSLQSILASSMWERPYTMLTHLNYDLAKNTFYSFQPGISLTLEGLYYTGFGLMVGFLIYQGLLQTIILSYKALMSLFRKHKTA